MEGKISLQQCITQLSYRNCKSSEFIEFVKDDSIEDEDEEEVIDNDVLRNSEYTGIVNDLTCVICCVKAKSILLLACRHYKICKDCFLTMKNQSDLKKVHWCALIVEKSLKIIWKFSFSS